MLLCFLDIFLLDDENVNFNTWDCKILGLLKIKNE